jgi:hypothetical protein
MMAKLTNVLERRHQPFYDELLRDVTNTAPVDLSAEQEDGNLDRLPDHLTPRDGCPVAGCGAAYDELVALGVAHGDVRCCEGHAVHVVSQFREIADLLVALPFYKDMDDLIADLRYALSIADRADGPLVMDARHILRLARAILLPPRKTMKEPSPLRKNVLAVPATSAFVSFAFDGLFAKDVK